jgi:hemerythrin superfamily protein
MDDYFCNLREELVRHEVAEELIVYPAFREHVEGAASIADACIAEQSRAEEKLAAMADQDATSPMFRTRLAELRQAVLAHAQHEERDVFPALQRAIDPAELGTLGDRYDKALESAPAHPHPTRRTRRRGTG